MRIVSGKYKGKKLLCPQGAEVRPTGDMVKESIFNMFQFDMMGAHFLDLFAGSGGVGIEAISRGAGKVVFVDCEKKSLELVKENLVLITKNKQQMRLEEKTNSEIREIDGCKIEILLADFKRALSLLRGEKYDFIFVDPPYASDFLPQILQLIKENALLCEGGRVIFEHLHKKTLQNIAEGFIIDKEKKYGTIAISVISRDAQCCAE